MKLGFSLRRLGVMLVALMAISSTTASAVTVQLNPIKDNSLFSELGTLSNGMGEYIFAGETAVGALRRALIAFDIAGSIPAGATINSVSLTLNVSKEPLGNFDPHNFFLHRATQDWGEGASDALIEEGTGAAAEVNDATWTHRFFNTVLWTAQGGDFGPVSATNAVGPGLGPETWTSAQMAADVQSMLDNPASNFGWILLGEEGVLASARRFDSKDLILPGAVPVLEVDFSPPAPAASDWALLIMTLLMAVAGGFYLRRRTSVQSA